MKQQKLCLLAGLVLALTPAMSRAQVGATFATLEWLAADSEVVVRATIAEIAPDMPTDSTDQRIWMVVTLKVQETLKGKPAKTQTFAVQTSAFDKTFEQWQSAGTDQLWFLVRNEEYADKPAAKGKGMAARYPLRPYGGHWSSIRLGPPVEAERNFTAMPPPIFTMDLKVLEKPKDILEATRTAVADAARFKPTHSHGMMLPHLIADRTHHAGDANALVVPVDQRLETLARQLIQSADNFLRPELDHLAANEKAQREWDTWVQFSRDQLRAEGVRALAYFKSDQNIGLLKPLLKDPTCQYLTSGGGNDPEIKERVFIIREGAFKTLTQWGINVSKPLLRERVAKDKD